MSIGHHEDVWHIECITNHDKIQHIESDKITHQARQGQKENTNQYHKLIWIS